MTGVETDVDVDRVAAYLGDRLDVTVVDLAVLHDGLNLSLAVRTAEGADTHAEREYDYVLRRPNKLRHTDSFNDVRGEFAVLSGLQDTAVPAPEPVLVCEDAAVLGDPTLVTTFVEGEPVHLGSHLPERWQTPAARDRFATRLVDTLAAVHTVDTAPFAEPCNRRSARDQAERAADRLDVARDVTGHEFEPLRDVAEWLVESAPPSDRTSLVHGDYRPANVLFVGDDDPDVAGVLDWETAFLGDPLTELGYLLLRWRDDGDPTPSLDGIRDRHGDSEAIRALERDNERGLAPFTNEPGSPTRRVLVSRYEERTGLDYDNDRFYRALAAFMLASVWADLDRSRVGAGGTPERAPAIEYVALLAQLIVDGEFEL